GDLFGSPERKKNMTSSPFVAGTGESLSGPHSGMRRLRKKKEQGLKKHNEIATKNGEEDISKINQLPDELLLYIMSFLCSFESKPSWISIAKSICPLLVVSLVCRRWKDLSEDDELWEVPLSHCTFGTPD